MQKTRGILKNWKDDKGFGFIKPDTGDTDVFVHIRDFGSISRKPMSGDIVFYQPMQDVSGRFRAADVQIVGLPRIQRLQNNKRNTSSSQRKTREEIQFGWTWIFGIIVVLIVAWLTYTSYFTPPINETTPIADTQATQQNLTQFIPRQASFTCEGKTHCSEIKSCEEATFYQQHCPNTKMDGNHDGVPCENQWCK